MSRSSFITSTIDSLVLSVCTGAMTMNGRWPRAVHNALRAVAPVLVEPEVAVQARGGDAAEVAHHGLDGQVLGLPAGLGHVRRDDDGLRRAGPIDQIDASGPRWRHGLDALGRRLTRGPRAERALELGHQRGQGDIAGDDERGVAGMEPVAMPLHEIVAGQRRDGRLEARARSAECRRHGPAR